MSSATMLLLKRSAGCLRLPPPDVRRLVAHGDVHQAQALVHTGHRPGVGRVANILAPGRQGRGFVRVARVPVPHQLAAVDVEPEDHTGRFVGGVVVGYAGRSHKDAVSDHGGRGWVEGAPLDGSLTGFQVHHATLAEAGAGLAGIGIDCHEGSVGGGGVNAARALADGGRIGSGAPIGGGIVIGDAATDHVLIVTGIAVDAWVEAPALAAGVGVEGDHDVVRRADVEHAVGLERGDLVGHLVRVARALEVAGVELPSAFQAGYVGRRDLAQRCITVAIAGMAIRRPIARGEVGGLVTRGCGFGQAPLQGAWRRTEEHAVYQQHRSQQQHDAQQGDFTRELDRAVSGGEPIGHPGQRQPQAKHDPQVQARHQLPAVQSDLDHRPHHRAGQKHNV